MYTSSNNPLIEDSFLGSKYLDPNYLFDRGLEIINFIFNSKSYEILNVVLSVFSIFFITVIIYTTVRMFEIRRKEHRHLKEEIAEYAHRQALKEEKFRENGSKNERWIKILDYLISDNENDWRLAIIEADSMLFDLLDSLGFKGETLGDKLKGTDLDNYPALKNAWEVHNIRNKIAHEGSSFNLSLHETERVINLYEQIFTQFRYI